MLVYLWQQSESKIRAAFVYRNAMLILVQSIIQVLQINHGIEVCTT